MMPVWVEPLDTHAAWRHMAAFTDLVRNDELRAKLGDAIEGRGAFRRFRREVNRHESLRQASPALAGYDAEKSSRRGSVRLLTHESRLEALRLAVGAGSRRWEATTLPITNR